MLARSLFGFNSGHLSETLSFPVLLKHKISLQMSLKSSDRVEC